MHENVLNFSTIFSSFQDQLGSIFLPKLNLEQISNTTQNHERRPEVDLVIPSRFH